MKPEVCVWELERHYQKYGISPSATCCPAEVYRGLPDVNMYYQEEPVLHFASSYADHEGVQILIDAGADVKAVCKDGRNALHAIVYGHGSRQEKPEFAVFNTATTLIKAGADTEATLLNGEGIIHLAAKHGLEEFVGAIHTAGLQTVRYDFSGNTPLHLACSYTILAVQNFLLYRTHARHRLDDASSGDGRDNQLEYERENAAREFERRQRQLDRFYKTVEFLLSIGHDPTVKNLRGESAMDIVCGCEDERLAEMVGAKMPRQWPDSQELWQDAYLQ